MQHVEPVQLQAYLTGELDLPALDAITEHLAQCAHCSERLALLAADDAVLAHALALDDAERTWIDSLDLAQSVRRRLAPWYRQPQVLVLVALLLAGSGLMETELVGLLGQLVAWQGPIGLLTAAVRNLAVLLWDLALYVSNGGLLASTWPILALGAGVWLVRHQMKEAKRYA